MHKGTIAIIGAGYMAKEYYKVLKGMGRLALVLGRGEQKARKFEEELGARAYTGDYREILRQQKSIPEYAIVAVNVGSLCPVALELMRLGVPNILVEKPVAYSGEGLVPLLQEQRRTGAKVYVAYNRRFFASVNRARELIEADGDITSFHFEFTEWAHAVGPTKRPA